MRFFKIILFALIGIMAFFSIFMIIDFFFGRRNFRNEDVSNIYKDGVIKNTNKADSISRELSNLKSIENIDIQIELEHLKNQAFCDLQWKLFTSNSCVNDDASGYMHISNLDIKYFNDANLKRIINKWVEKEYNAKDERKNLNTMKCFGFLQ
ncbi:MAG: hypothetical protein IPG48_12975 [Saprospiraceae bacterium]|nr:hypothetical protein [Saprospiraceae bacterium]MBK8826216.1 hypothetical protein [Saprospiraceae bacterium]MBK9584032.1 hypothetical protein [Saprospiraceae bacterium]